jgi:hypothetical protein
MPSAKPRPVPATNFPRWPSSAREEKQSEAENVIVELRSKSAQRGGNGGSGLTARFFSISADSCPVR